MSGSRPAQGCWTVLMACVGALVPLAISHVSQHKELMLPFHHHPSRGCFTYTARPRHFARCEAVVVPPPVGSRVYDLTLCTL
mmetsp:Transcript_25514/g.63270  ORF Transcript_25514/g.63270 Transcript_25514/m.63270 type:complete len:82 (+) Transcript_25514:620-865(+)